VSALSLLLLASLIVLSGCTGISRVDKKKLAPIDKVAVVAVGANKYIDMEEFGLGQNIMAELAKDDEFDVTPAVTSTHRFVFGDFRTRLPFELLDEKRIVPAERYQAFVAFPASPFKDLQARHFVGARVGNHAYKPVLTSWIASIGIGVKERRDRLFATVPDEADAIMLVHVSYKLDKEASMFGAGMARIIAYLQADIVDRKGRTVLSVVRNATSRDQVEFAFNSVVSPKKIQPLCLDATDQALRAMDAYLRAELADA
jgi:hypothetical protein